MAKMKSGDDPKDFRVSEVQDYLKTASDEEKARVVAAEQDRENPDDVRKGVVGDEAGAGEAVADLGTAENPRSAPEGAPQALTEEPAEEGPVESSDFEVPEGEDDVEKASIARTIAKQI